MNEVFLNLPTTMAAFVKENEDGSHTIVYNARLDFETLQNTERHEIWHISRGDLESDAPVDRIEAWAHRLGKA
ncbi:MAG: hypothetical protein PUE64_00505 [Firmicutes bacterium]|nr:hypothetical protein [Bacillota bacterium]